MLKDILTNGKTNKFNDLREFVIKSIMKQYLSNKPHKWGYKIFILANDKGMMYDFMLYIGNIDLPFQI